MRQSLAALLSLLFLLWMLCVMGHWWRRPYSPAVLGEYLKQKYSVVSSFIQPKNGIFPAGLKSVSNQNSSTFTQKPGFSGTKYKLIHWKLLLLQMLLEWSKDKQLFLCTHGGLYKAFPDPIAGLHLPKRHIAPTCITPTFPFIQAWQPSKQQILPSIINLTRKRNFTFSHQLTIQGVVPAGEACRS